LEVDHHLLGADPAGLLVHGGHEAIQLGLDVEIGVADQGHDQGRADAASPCSEVDVLDGANGHGARSGTWAWATMLTPLPSTSSPRFISPSARMRARPNPDSSRSLELRRINAW